jgi:hypothetical protein
MKFMDGRAASLSRKTVLPHAGGSLLNALGSGGALFAERAARECLGAKHA